MTTTGWDFREVAARAQSLSERLERPGGSFRATTDDPFDAWCEAVGGEAELSRRLSAAGLDGETAVERVSTCGFDEGESLPEWVSLVTELQTFLSESVPDRGRTVADWEASLGESLDGADESRRPFEHVLVPIAEFAVDRLERTTDSDVVTERAVYEHATDLLTRLDRALVHPLFVGLKTDLRADSTPETEGDTDSRRGYWRFVEAQLAGGCRYLFEAYPLSARWTATVVRQWIESFEEFTARLEQDLSAVSARFLESEDSPSVVAVRGRGDFHNDGRRVFRVDFETDETVAYKPRALGPEAGFSSVLSWVNERSSLRPFRVPTCLDRGKYGWMEWIEPEPCVDTAGPERYFRQAGAAICLLYALRFHDGNVQNIAAVGEQIVVHDVEAIAQPELPTRHEFGEPTYDRLIDESVLRTGLVPMQLGDADLRHLNGIDKPSGEIEGTNVRKFTDTNTDAMELSYERTGTLDGDSLPVLDGETHDPREYADEIIDGFRSAYDFLLDHRATLLSPDGPLAAFADTRVRFFYRESAAYGKAMRPLWTSPYLRSGLDAGLRIEQLTRRLDLASHPDSHWRVYRAERDAVWRMDVPRFAVNTTDRDVRVAGDVLSAELPETPLESLRNCVRSLDEADRERQVEYLVLAYDHEQLLKPDPPTEGSIPDTLGGEGATDRPDWETLAATECEKILDRLDAAATERSDGTLTWYQRVNRDGSVALQSPRHDLYDGRIGIGMFAAAMAETFGWDRARRLAVDAVEPVLDELDSVETPQSVQKFGAGHGAGSVMYGLTRLGQWLDEPRFLAAAERASEYVTPTRLADAETLDLIGGVAGVIPGLLALHEETGERRHLDRAVAAGERLLDSRTTIDGVETWPLSVSDGRPMVGPAHGVSGVSVALDRLAAVADRPAFAEAARTALGVETDHYRPEEQNWPDYRLDTCRRGWCAGRSGVGLTRLVMSDGDDEVRRGLDRALDGASLDTLMDEDDICCGNFSRVEFLLTAARRLDRPELRTDAERLALGTVERARENGGYTVAWQTPEWYATSLYLGEMGIGYSLCRLAGYDRPSLLLWE